MLGSIRNIQQHVAPMALAARSLITPRLPVSRHSPCSPPSCKATENYVQIREISKAARQVMNTRRNVKVLESNMSYVDTGPVSEGDDTVVFLHGNPSAAFLWRDVIPEVQGTARCLAPDLLGMGHSGKSPDLKYRFMDHYEYLSAWLDKMNLPQQVSLVMHDWGMGLGLHWANKHKDRVQSLVVMEGMARTVPGWNMMPEVLKEPFTGLRSSNGKKMVYEKNYFVEKFLKKNVMRQLSAEEMEEYRAPYLEARDRVPTLVWPREIPIAGEPADVHQAVDDYHNWISGTTDLPKLYVHADPGLFSPLIQKTITKWPAVRSVTVEGLHFLQEDSGPEIGRSIAEFLKDVYSQTSGISWHDVRVKAE